MGRADRIKQAIAAIHQIRNRDGVTKSALIVFLKEKCGETSPGEWNETVNNAVQEGLLEIKNNKIFTKSSDMPGVPDLIEARRRRRSHRRRHSRRRRGRRHADDEDAIEEARRRRKHSRSHRRRRRGRRHDEGVDIIAEARRRRRSHSRRRRRHGRRRDEDIRA